MESKALTLGRDSSVERLKRIIGDRYGKDLVLRPLINLGDEAQNQEYTLRGDDLHIVIKVKDNFLGTIVINKAKDMSEDRRKEAADIVRMVMEPTMYNWFLTTKESNLLVEKHAEKDHLVGLHLYEYENDEDEFDEVEPTSISHMILLQGQNPMLLKKISLEIHEISERWAMLPLVDVENCVDNLADFLELGEITIVIDKVENLSVKMQDILKQFIYSKPNHKHPLVIANTLQDTKMLLASQLNSNLAEELIANSFEVDRAPLDFRKLREVLEIFFFKSREAELDS